MIGVCNCQPQSAVMEKRLPMTAAIVESVAAGYVTTIVVQKAEDLGQVILASAAVVTILAIVLWKNIRLIAVAYLGGLVLTLSASRPPDFYLPFLVLLLAAIAFEGGAVLIEGPRGQSRRGFRAALFNATLTLLALLLVYGVKVLVCPPLTARDPVSWAFEFYFAPNCGLNVASAYSASWGLGAQLEQGLTFLTWPPNIALGAASLAETLRRPGRNWLPIRWLGNYLRTMLIAVLIMFGLALAIGVGLLPLLRAAGTTNSFPVLAAPTGSLRDWVAGLGTALTLSIFSLTLGAAATHWKAD